MRLSIRQFQCAFDESGLKRASNTNNAVVVVATHPRDDSSSVLVHCFRKQAGLVLVLPMSVRLVEAFLRRP